MPNKIANVIHLQLRILDLQLHIHDNPQFKEYYKQCTKQFLL